MSQQNSRTHADSLTIPQQSGLVPYKLIVQTIHSDMEPDQIVQSADHLYIEIPADESIFESTLDTLIDIIANQILHFKAKTEQNVSHDATSIVKNGTNVWYKGGINSKAELIAFLVAHLGHSCAFYRTCNYTDSNMFKYSVAYSTYIQLSPYTGVGKCAYYSPEELKQYVVQSFNAIIPN